MRGRAASQGSVTTLTSETLPGTSRTLDVLLVEDDPGDVLIAREAMAAGQLSTRLEVVSDGVEAIAYLRGEDSYAGMPRPDLILLDLNLPRKSGHEVLADIKADPELRRIPVVVLTTSRADEDVVKSYDLHASVHVSKPVDFDDYAGVVKQIDEFFGSVAQLPAD
jgi:chemotaxis family two-component system response regulator Rcp1